MHEVLVNRLGGLSLPKKSVVRVTVRPDMTLDVYRGRKIAIHYISCINPNTDIFCVGVWYESFVHIYVGGGHGSYWLLFSACQSFSYSD